MKYLNFLVVKPAPTIPSLIAILCGVYLSVELSSWVNDHSGLHWPAEGAVGVARIIARGCVICVSMWGLVWAFLKLCGVFFGSVSNEYLWASTKNNFAFVEVKSTSLAPRLITLGVVAVVVFISFSWVLNNSGLTQGSVWVARLIGQAFVLIPIVVIISWAGLKLSGILLGGKTGKETSLS